MKLKKLSNEIFCISKFCSNAICNEFIAILEESNKFPKENKPDLNNTSLDENLANRNNFKISFINYELANIMWESLKNFEINYIKNWTPVSINPNFRCYKYNIGQQFSWHADCPIKFTTKKKSLLSLLLYLNDDFGGGATLFKEFEVKPKKGSILLFPHNLLHAGEILNSGTKYIIRTDVIFQKT
jgi:prolyl 4-hydroxylase